jgi:spore coat protein A
VRHTNRLAVPTVVHLHGGRTPPESDGFPVDTVAPGETREYVYPNEQAAATLWYHDHTMGATGRNIYMGLAGLYVLGDDAEDRLGLPRGDCDVPLVLQRKQLAADGSIAYPGGRFGADGDTILVNGAPWPRFEVARRRYRFRLLNAANATLFDLNLDSGEDLAQIATDGGLLPAPARVPHLPLGPAERAEVVVDFARYALGARVVLRSGGRAGDQAVPLLRFDVARDAPDDDDDSVLPEALRPLEPIPERAAARARELVFGAGPQAGLPPIDWAINGRDFDPDRAAAAVPFGDVEIWRLRNRPLLGRIAMAHPVHVHLVHFQVLDRNGAPPPPHERGWKDTVVLGEGDEVRVVARFDGHRGRYVLHCHNLEHEDHSMMARFDVV